MSLHRFSSMCAAVALATAVSTSSALAQTPTPRTPAEPRAQQTDMASTVQGQLDSVDATTKTLVVKTAAGVNETLRYDDNTKVTGGERGVAGLTNSKGSEVTVKFRGTGEDRVATEITIRPKKS